LEKFLSDVFLFRFNLGFTISHALNFPVVTVAVEKWKAALFAGFQAL
jgi:hypothetical protein